MLRLFLCKALKMKRFVTLLTVLILTISLGKQTVSASTDTISWPGLPIVLQYDYDETLFQSDTSGLDFYDGKLYAIDNACGTFWVLDVDEDCHLSWSDGFTKDGKHLAFQKDAEHPSLSSPDAEGIAVDESGNAYAAVERNNYAPTVNQNSILMFDPWAGDENGDVVASMEWDVTDLLPDVKANKGIEGIEWVSNRNLEGKLYDRNTKAVYDPSLYPDSSTNGVVFVALEDNGHVYALILNKDSSATLIADIKSGIGGAMALDYDVEEEVLWVGADDGYGNMSARIVFDGTKKPEITLVKPPMMLDTTRNYEGLAIAGSDYTLYGYRPVFHVMDGEGPGVLTIAFLACS